MNSLSIVLTLFIILEGSNVFLLYFYPNSKKGNGVGIFNAFEQSKEYPEIHAFIKYLVNWIAGTKLIFIALLIAVLLTGDERTQFISILALIITVSTFYWRLYPILKSMDARGTLNPHGYSKTLGFMIALFLLVFCGALVWYLI